MFYAYTMMHRSLITSVGEALVDFVSADAGPLEDSSAFLPRLGGESANVAVGVAKLGGRSAFVGRVGSDAFGRFIISQLKRHGVDISGVRQDRQHRTRLAFVSRRATGDRDFAFREDSPAGGFLSLRDIPRRILAASAIVNIAPLLLLREPSRSTAFRLARKVRSRGVPVAFDVNLRLNLWRSASEARRVTLKMIRASTILRLNDDEAYFLTGTHALPTASTKLLSWGPLIATITLGKRGCYIRTRSFEGRFPAPGVRALDTTGCGDAFFAALLHGILLHGGALQDIDQDSWERICRYANTVGALTACNHGGADAIPDSSAVEKFIHARTTP